MSENNIEGIWVLQNYPVMVTENCWKNAFLQKNHWNFPSYVVKYRRKNPTNFKILEIFRRRRWNWSEYSISAVRKLFRQPDTLVQRHPSLLTEFTIRPCNSAGHITKPFQCIYCPALDALFACTQWWASYF
jgi:hypothetical protein